MKDIKFSLTKNIQSIIDTLENNGYEAYIVGGCVRDILMGKTPCDYDITTSAAPDETIECCKDKKLVLTGLKHGTVAVVTENGLVEITSFRTEGAYSDNRHPDEVSFVKNIKKDLARRDFTINAIAYSPTRGLVDPFNGIDDINKKIIKCVGNAQKRFDEDALRIMRAIRFSSVLGFPVEENTAKAIKEKRELIKNVAPERVRAELEKLLNGKNVFDVLMNFSDVIFISIPELEASVDTPQNCIHHIYTVWEHICLTVKNIEPDKNLRLTMLLHDIGKPFVRKTDENGQDHFKTHAQVGSEMAKNILKRLKFDNKTIKEVEQLIIHHDDRLYKKTDEMPFHIHNFGYDFLRKLDKISRADILSQSPDFFFTLDLCDEFIKVLDKCEKEKICTEISGLKIDGNDLTDLGFSGEKIGQALNTLLFKVMKNEIKNDKEELIVEAKKMSH